MHAAELVKMDDASLKKQLNDLEHEMFNFRFQRAAGQLTNPNRLVEVRREIARVKTVLRARQLASAAMKEKAG